MKILLRYEKYFFLLLVLLHLLPVLLIEFFVTHDGPAHVYNSCLIARLLNGDALTAKYFEFNPNPVPNWLGHALLYLFNLLTAGNISERILLCLYIAGLPLSFRYLLLTLKKDAHWATYLAFPFIYSLLFYLGFYNFCIGIPLLFFTLAFYIQHIPNLSPKKIPVFILLGLLMYFSHIFIIALFSLAAASYLIMQFIFSLKDHQKDFALRLFFHRVRFLALSLLPCVLLAVLFIRVHAKNNGGFQPMNLSEYFKFLFMLRPLITLRFETEQIFSIAAALAFWVLFLYVVSVRIKKLTLSSDDAWFLLSLIILAAYFLLPDQLATGQFVTMRMLLFYYLFSILWLSLHSIPRWLRIFSIVINITVSLWFLNYHYRESKNLSDEAEEYISCLEVIKEGSIVLPLNYSSNFMSGNLLSYCGAMKNILDLDNYEAETNHFPVNWKPGMNPYQGKNMTAISMTQNQIEEYESNTDKKIDFIIRWCFNNSFTDSASFALNKYISEKYVCVFISLNGKAEVFRRVN